MPIATCMYSPPARRRPAPMLLFRARLRASDADRAACLRVKRDLAGRTWRHAQHYADATTVIEEQVIARASRPRPGN